MSFSNLKEWTTPRGKVVELAINGKIAWKYHTHSYTAKVTAPTCTAQGYTTHTCSCGDSYKDTYTAAGHKYGTAYLSDEFSTGYGQKCSVCGALKALSNPYVSGLAVGSTVYMNVSGSKTSFIVVHQGLPSSVYDSSCDGTWLMMKNAWKTGEKFDAVSHDYADSDLHFLLNSIFYGYLDSGVKSAVKQVELPCHYGTLTARVFSLSYTEVGFSGDSYAPVEGAVLSYFNGVPDDVRIARYNGNSPVEWWLRTPRIFTVRGTSTWAVYHDGTAIYSSCTKTRSTRPAFILRSDTLIDGTLISKT